MTISGWWTYMNKKLGHLFHDVGDIRRWSTQKFGIDTSIYMHRFIGEDMSVAPIEQFLDQARELMEAGVTPIFIFDGKRSPIKQHEHARRAEQRKKMVDQHHQRKDFLAKADAHPAPDVDMLRQMAGAKPPPDVAKALLSSSRVEVTGFGEIVIEQDIDTALAKIRERHNKEASSGGRREIPDEHYHALMQTLDDNQIGYYIAKTDAEKLGAQLTRQKKIDVLVTDDGDAIAFGATRIIRNLFGGGKSGMQYIDTAEILAEIGLNKEQMVDLAIICGCDYTLTSGIPSLGPAKALKILAKHGSLQAYMDSLDFQALESKLVNSDRYQFDRDDFQYELARSMFLDDADQVAYASKTIDPTAPQIPMMRRQVPRPMDNEEVVNGIVFGSPPPVVNPTANPTVTVYVPESTEPVLQPAPKRLKLDISSLPPPEF